MSTIMVVYIYIYIVFIEKCSPDLLSMWIEFFENT